jgi:hypothetical protein
MEKYFKRKSELELPPSTKRVDNSFSSTKRVDNSFSKEDRVEINLVDLPSDPGLRPRITDYHPNDRDQVRRAYAQRKARQPKFEIKIQKVPTLNRIPGSAPGDKLLYLNKSPIG